MKRKSNNVRFRRRRQSWASMIGDIRLVMLAGFGVTLAVLNVRGDPPLVAAGERSQSLMGAALSGGDISRARFGLCHSGGGSNCVVDGDTFWFGGQKIRIADIDTPETHPPRCAEEARLGGAATQRLHALLNAGPFTLESADRDTDRYGRALRIVRRDGQSLGGVLVDEGLARWYDGGRQPWC